MKVTLFTHDGKELTVEIRSMRAFPVLIQWDSSERGNVIPRYFVRSADQFAGVYAEAIPEPVVSEAATSC